MLKSLFNTAAHPGYLPEKPVILVNTVGDDCHRGDNHAYMGIAKIVTQKLGGDYRLVTNDTLKTDYPDTRPEDSINLYYRDHGMPDIIFSHNHNRYYSRKTVGDHSKKRPYVIDDINEDLSAKTYFSTVTLVAHHLTPALLAEEGVKLAQAYPDIKSPLIAVLMADSEYGGLAENLIPRLKNEPEATIFVCTGRRTYGTTLNAMMDTLKKEIKQAGRSKDINLLQYDFRENRNTGAFNPYIGLIDRADHIVICGDSHSIISESLSKQQAVYVNRNYSFMVSCQALVERGLVNIFTDSTKNDPLVKTPVDVPNPTEEAADRVIFGYKRHCCRQLGLLHGALAYVTGG
jgi:mitochondrial fission protein ELM1